jgi:cysteine desulfuration protein SufE
LVGYLLSIRLFLQGLQLGACPKSRVLSDIVLKMVVLKRPGSFFEFMPKSMKELQDEIIDEFADFEDWEERFQYLIELGDDLPEFPEELHQDEFLVRGCQSRVWVKAELREGRLYFLADSDTALTKGLIAILIRVLSGHAPESIAEASLDFIETIGLKKFLSMNRRNGLNSMIELLMDYAKNANSAD